jgi:predicted ATPase
MDGAAFVGRSADLVAVRAALDAGALLTIIGPAGVGKTRLALEAVRDRAHRLIDLSSTADGEAAADRVRDALASSRRDGQIVVVDNCEHVVEGIAPVLAMPREVPILVTSRRATEVAGEERISLEPLAVPPRRAMPPADRLETYDAVRLFVSCAQRHDPAFMLTDDVAPIVAELCVELDGLPLAIELAAARLDVLAPGEVAERLDDRFRLLRTGGGRSRNLEDAIAGSVELASAPARRLLAQLACIPGPFGIDLIEAVCDLDPGEDALDLLGELLRLHLVVAETEQGRRRFRLLMSVQAFAARDIDDPSGLRERLLAHVATAPLARTPLDTVRATLERAIGAEDARAYPVALALADELHRRGEGLEALRWLERARNLRNDARAAFEVDLRCARIKMIGLDPSSAEILERIDPTDATDEERVELTMLSGMVAYLQRDSERARVLLESALPLLTPGTAAHTGCVANLATVLHEIGDTGGALERYAEAERGYRAIDDRRSMLQVQLNRATLFDEQGDQAQAVAVYREMLPEVRSIGDARLEAMVLVNSGNSLGGLGELDEAARFMLDAAEASVRLRWIPPAAISIASLGMVALERGDPALAARLWTVARSIDAGWAQPSIDEERLAKMLDASAIEQERAVAATMTLEDAIIDARTSLAPITSSAEPTSAPAPADVGAFSRSGDAWEVSYDGSSVVVLARKGIEDIVALLAQPGTPIHVVDLAVVDADVARANREQADEELIDAEGRRMLRAARERLLADEDDARALGDTTRAESFASERERIEHALTAAYGLGGRVRRTGSDVERIRKAVTNRIRNAIASIAGVHPALGAHLRVSIRTGVTCAYEPERPVRWSLDRSR